MNRILTNYFKYIFYLDARSVALSRICIYLCLLINFLQVARNIPVLYTDQGLLPRDLARILLIDSTYFSLNYISGSMYFQYFLVAIGIISSVFCILGIMMRVSSVVSWILYLSFFYRNILMLDGGDDVLKIYLLLFCFIPSAQYFTLTASSNHKHKEISTLGSAAFMLQIITIYFYSALLKTSDEWRVTGEAIHRTLALQVYTSSAGEYLLSYPHFLSYVSLVIWKIEYFVPLMILIPWKNLYFRCFFVVTFLCFQISLAIFLTLGIFPYIMISVLVGLLPKEFWEMRIGNFVHNVLEGIFNYLKNFKFSPFYSFPNFRENIYSSAFYIFFIIYICIWNLHIANYNSIYRHAFPQFRIIGTTIGMSQHWALFAPRPARYTGWIIEEASLKNGEIIDLRTNAPVTFKRPETVSNQYASARWKKYFLFSLMGLDKSYRKAYAKYLCNSWNSKHEENRQITNLKIYYMKEVTRPPFKKTLRKKPQKKIAVEYACKPFLSKEQ